MSEQTKIKHSPAVEGKKHHKVRWIVLAVLLAIVAAAAAWYLIRFEFNRDYQAYIEAPAGAAAQSELAALTDENPNVAAPFQLFAENDNLKLYADLETANVAIYDKRSGETGSDQLGPQDARDLLGAWLHTVGLNMNERDLLDHLQSENVSHSSIMRLARGAHERRLAQATWSASPTASSLARWW